MRRLSQDKRITFEQVQNIVQGVVQEILFDVVQAFEAPIYRRKHLENSKTLLSLSDLTGIGDGMQVEWEEGVSPDPYYRLPFS